ncbi:hypothetical protein [Hymenobacter armeniacus]|uniref:Tetratricopeptide repeat protein n=1 Tax=Hymenobacter armeniacus TaxID=2771358 RepID=A0ABR8JRJ3_9BACT|nr:hypothetical protein [Hymenobacter armeniacus]MBD2720569.1 hypothetical protein [Hymenobacter armeniacus]
MKTALLTLALAAASLAAVAQTQPAPAATAAPADAYTAMLGATIAEQNAITQKADLPANLAKLERAASARPTDWLPRYYQARGYLKMAFGGSDSDQADKLLDQADAALAQAKKLPGADQAEVLVLQAYIYQGRIQAAPMTRGALYTGRVHEALDQALKLSPDNPRAYLVLANDLYYRPAMFGGGAEKAKPLYEKAKALFAAFKPATALSPNWGEATATATLARINGTDTTTAATK